jgi:hypothetical protein
MVMKYKGNLQTARKLTGFRALYFHYLYLMGKIPKHRPRPPSQVHFRYREDLIKIDRISREITLLCRHRIDTQEQLSSFRAGLTGEIEALAAQRQELRNSIRRPKDEKTVAETKAQIALLSARMGEIRREVRLCDDIAARSEQFKEKIRQARQEQEQKIEERGKSRYDKFR